MKVLVTFAVSAEFAPWRRLAGFRPYHLDVPALHHAGRYQLYRAEAEDSEIFVVLTGMGCEGARRATLHALAVAPEICVSSGLAGGLRPSYSCGDVLVAAHVAGFGRTEQSLACSSKLVDAAVACGARRAQRFLTVSEVVVQKSVKRSMGEFGDAVEMESLGVLAAAQGAGIPAVAIRAISDPVDEDLPLDFNQVLDRGGKVRGPELLRELFSRPGSVPGLLRFARDARRAAISLADFLDRYVRTLDEYDGCAKAMRLVATA